MTMNLNIVIRYFSSHTIQVLNIVIKHFSDQLVLFLSTKMHYNQPMIIDTNGKLKIMFESLRRISITNS